MSVIKIETASYDGYNLDAVYHMGLKWIIGGLPQAFGNEYFNIAKDADAIVLLTSKPEFCGGLSQVIDVNPDVKIYASSAGLRNIKEVANRPINEVLIKDEMEVDGFKFYITPNIHWVDTVMVNFGGTLYSGEMFSQSESMEGYYNDNLSVNRSFVKLALERLKDEEIETIIPAIGEKINNVERAFNIYSELTKDVEHTKTAGIVYSSQYGFTESMAEFLKDKLCLSYSVYLIDANVADVEEATQKLNSCDLIAIGTNTINRNAPKKIWDIITGLDLINMRGIPYFVFGSFGWAGDGIKLVDKTLANMGLKSIIKPIGVLFKPTDDDFSKLERAVIKVNEYTKGNE